MVGHLEEEALVEASLLLEALVCMCVEQNGMIKQMEKEKILLHTHNIDKYTRLKKCMYIVHVIPGWC